MLRKFVCAVFVLFVGVGFVIAADEMMKAKIEKVDLEKGRITIKGDGADAKPININVEKQKTKLLGADGKELADGIKSKDLKEGTEVTVTFEKKDNKTTYKEIKINKK